MADFASEATVTYTETVDYVDSSYEWVITNNMTETETVEITVATVLLSIGLGIIIIGTIFGNALTLTAISRHRPLQTPQNHLIASLAVADLMVAILVMPLSLTKEIVVVWIFGPILCDVWISLDVLLCTASILSLCMISLDRFWAITKPIKYPKYRTARTMVILIALAWFLSSIIATSPFFGWRGNQSIDAYTCQISQNIAYTIFSTFGAYFIPMTIMMIVYARIYCEARKRIRGKTFNRGCQPLNSAVNYRETTNYGDRKDSEELNKSPTVKCDPASDNNKGGGVFDGSTLSHSTHTSSAPNLQNQHKVGEEVKKDTFVTSLTVPGQHQATFTSTSLREINSNESPSSQRSLLSSPSPLPGQIQERERRRRATATAKEHRATKTLGIVTGAFLVCWLPFFLHALIVPLCGESCNVPRSLESIFLWLGYFNSMLNPIIYTKFNRDFQKAFKKLLHCKESKSQSF
ncbi:5-hydroxytryptamine receptor 1D-like [Strongylocentrotus purpuratus]|uniref:G-protein coupled receptors family 1 profile domain-containing protein n=1 Tax=Strongylocentrotus purpuratus TaxID=7668 RepID=A0A7M7RBR3_STRPU|nr:5-hydroxytryptamine receptor 1D-like [Strongylocentrotus purpuratus]XP_780260.2 5-hydroxytryptamine receptor 1D-like [Strongylocentrotus purpuratus]